MPDHRSSNHVRSGYFLVLKFFVSIFVAFNAKLIGKAPFLFSCHLDNVYIDRHLRSTENHSDETKMTNTHRLSLPLHLLENRWIDPWWVDRLLCYSPKPIDSTPTITEFGCRCISCFTYLFFFLHENCFRFSAFRRWVQPFVHVLQLANAGLGISNVCFI